MPRNTEGRYSLPSGTLVNSGDTILVSQHNPAMTDIATAIGNSLDRNGTGGMRAALNMGGNPVQNIASGSNPNDAATVAQATASAVPVGSVMDYAGLFPPSGYLFCFGQAVSRATYADLFAALGTLYGAGDGSTTFNVPDARGRVVAAPDNLGGTAAGRLNIFPAVAPGNAGGAQSVVLTDGQMPAHNHTGGTQLAGLHAHSTTLEARGAGGSDDPASPAWNIRTSTNYGNRTVPTNADGNHQHIIPTSGNNEAHNNVQPTLILNKIIKAL